MGVVVPHRAQRAALQQAFPELCVLDAATGLPARSAIDTVERFQGGERTVVLVSATESDRAYLLASGEFLLDPRRLTVAVSRAKRKMMLVASPQHLLAVQPGRGDVRQRAAVEEPAVCGPACNGSGRARETGFRSPSGAGVDLRRRWGRPSITRHGTNVGIRQGTL